MSKRVLFVSVEASGDDLSVDVMTELKKHNAELELLAIGGRSLERIGLASPLDISPLGVVGLIDGLKAYSKAVELADATVEYASENQVSAVVLIDAWGFTLRVAQRLKKRAPEIKVIKLIGPQVWATRPGRAKTLAETVDHLLCIHEFETPYYDEYGLPCTVIGNPAISRMKSGDGAAFRSKHHIAEDQDVVLVLPGSRRSELKRIAPTFVEAARSLKKQLGKKIQLAVLVSSDIRHTDEWAALDWPENTILVEQAEEKADVMSAATLALACSGTVTSELATQACPMVVGYKLGWLSWEIARLFLLKSKYITLSNIALDREIVPELIQYQLSVDNLVEQALTLLGNETLRQSQKEGLRKAAKAMGQDKPPAHVTAAKTISQLI